MISFRRVPLGLVHYIKKLIHRGFFFFFPLSEKGVNKQEVEEKFNSIGQFSLRLVHERPQKQSKHTIGDLHCCGLCFLFPVENMNEECNFIPKRREEKEEGKAQM